MIKTLTHILIAGLALLCAVSCEFEENQMGYPHNVIFPKDGGEQVFTGKRTFSYLIIAEGTEEHSSEKTDGMITVQHKWLTAKSREGSKQLIITAEKSSLKLFYNKQEAISQKSIFL